jgi:hypothetical protein
LDGAQSIGGEPEVKTLTGPPAAQIGADVMRLQYCFALICCLLVGCHADQSPSPTRQALAGNYVYRSVDTSVDRSTDHQFDRLTLNTDGTYDLVQGGSTKARSEKTGEWNIQMGDSPNVLLDHASYPIQMKKGEVRLLINDDLGEWYVKTQ